MPAAASAPIRAALVTGGAQRIGREIVRALARSGYAVAVHARASAGEAEALCAEIVAAGGRARTVTADLADHAAVLGLVGAAADAVGPLTLLVNNASEFQNDAIGGLDRAVFDRHMAVNLRAPIFLADAFAAQAPSGADASIVNLIDQRVYKPTPRFLSYGLSKSALHTATTTLAQALAPRVRVNAVAPGPTLPSPRQDAAAFARQARAVPLGRGPSPEEIADAVLYLAGARSVTGETIAVDGGQRLAWQTLDAIGVEE
ncbi:MAG: SDR family oxidoreductase [Rhodoplanes sp.]|uniref:SDR family oxidoreductase n=1 Tax=Rhodoplanes sp. TaxID=1968906 RepID=UPI0017F7663E|nr:SDR family oxidoreductase [Rhodoplanes sp.]NVO15937.1 SDR family oxidoreductase [Rhodoplanes sp.]